jgi:hypothetical protein
MSAMEIDPPEAGAMHGAASKDGKKRFEVKKVSSELALSVLFPAYNFHLLYLGYTTSYINSCGLRVKLY